MRMRPHLAASFWINHRAHGGVSGKSFSPRALRAPWLILLLAAEGGWRLWKRLVAGGVGGGDREEPIVGGDGWQGHLAHLPQRLDLLPRDRLRRPPVQDHVGDGLV